MLIKILILILLATFSAILGVAADQEDAHEFTYNGFLDANITLSENAKVLPNGLLRLTNTTTQNQIGHGFFSLPLSIKNSSFSSIFVIALVPQNKGPSGNGMAFVISPTKELAGAQPSQFLGVFNLTNNGNRTNHIVAVEFDTMQDPEFRDIDGNHVGIDSESLVSLNSSSAGYFNSKKGGFKNISLISGVPMQIWVDYNDEEKQMNVTISPIKIPKPSVPLLSSVIDLSSIVTDPMYVGFSAATGTILSSHYVLGWSFKLNGEASPLDLSLLPKLPHPKQQSKLLIIGLPIVASLLGLVAISCIVFVVLRKMKFSEVLEEWEIAYGPQRFSYKDLYLSTNGFKAMGLLGAGGFGKVYMGILPRSGREVAVKRISHDSAQGLKEFIAEIASIGRIRHPNLVRLLGYCRRKKELLLVYDFCSKGSLDKFIYDQTESKLSWAQRFQVVKDIASGLLFLHEGWSQVVLHRDIKPSNAVLDADFTGKLGDFGLSRLHDHGADPQSTRLVGTIGYMAPELSRTGQASTATDVYAFGVFALEVACGRRPIQAKTNSPEEVMLVDWVLECYKRGVILEAADRKLRNYYTAVEMELVLMLGLHCTHQSPLGRPTIRQVRKFLDGSLPLPEIPFERLQGSGGPAGVDKKGDGGGNLFTSSPSLESVSILCTGQDADYE